MEQQTKKNLIFGGSVAGAAILGLALGLGIGFGSTGSSGDTTNQLQAANTKGIGAFANLPSFETEGFNKGILEASNAYVNGYEGHEGIEEQFTIEQKTSEFSEDGAIYVDMLEDYYSTNDIVISAGFQVANAIGGNSLGNAVGGFPAGFEGLFERDNGLANSRTKAFVLLDDSVLSQLYTNVASVSFAAEGAGYMAGLAASAYTEYDSYTNHGGSGEDYTPNIVMWGGQPFPTVYDFMSGFELGVNDYNSAQGTNIVLWSGGLASGDNFIDDNSYTTENGTGNSNHWYSGGFDADISTTDGEVASIKTVNALQSNASVVFPVAGGNTTVAEGAIASADDTTTKLMGVDADATLSASNPELFLGTAEKKLVSGGQYALWTMDDFNGNGIRNYQELLRLGAVGYSNAYPDDIYFENNSESIISWHEAGANQIGPANELGVQMRGNAENGGVGLNIGGEKQDPTTEEPLLVTAINDVFSDIITTPLGEEELEQMFSDFAIARGDIPADSTTFTNIE